MRPIKLTMQAFGPYASREEIDFSALGSRTMFVISGKTGAGKTTIFDGISYAIYGKASGEDRNGSDLRSQFAEGDVPTEVSLVFTLRNKTYYIQRSPQQEKKKDRGEGYTTIGAKAELYELNSDGEQKLLAENVRDVDVKIKEIMLIDSNQFRQILMIPQGEFRKLLTSDSKEKELILQRLFHTEIYKKIEGKLKEEAKSLENSVEMHRKERNGAINRIQAVLHEELIALLDEGSDNDTIILRLLEEEIYLLAEELFKLKQDMSLKEAERDKLQQQIYEAERIITQLETKEELKEKKESLEKQKTDIEEKDKSIALAQKAALLMQQEEQCFKLKKELDEVNRHLQIIRTKVDELTEADTKWQEALNVEKEKEPERQKALEKVNELKNIEKDVRSLSLFQDEVEKIHRQLQEMSTNKDELEEKVKKEQNIVVQLKEEKRQLEKEQLIYYENERKMDKLKHEYELLLSFEKRKNEQNQAVLDMKHKENLFQHIQARFLDAKKLVEELEQKWLHGQAAILAQELKEGDGCPVCGSTHHPKPTSSFTNDIPTENDLKAAKEQYSQLENEKNEAQATLFKAQSDEKGCSDRLEELLTRILEVRADFKLDDLETVKIAVSNEKQQLQMKQDQWLKQQKRLEMIHQDIEIKEKWTVTQQEKLNELIKAENDLTVLFTEKKTILIEMLKKVPENLQTVEAFEKELQSTGKYYDTLVKRLESVEQSCLQNHHLLLEGKTRLEEVEKQAVQIGEKLVFEREAFKKQMEEQGFDSYASYAGARKTEQEVDDLQKEVRGYYVNYEYVSKQFDQLCIELEGVQRPDIGELNSFFEQKKKEIKSLQDRCTMLSVRKEENEKIVVKINEINNEIKELEEKYQLIGHLYEMTKGQNTYRITFERYVLAAFLDNILREANGRLAKMTNGRYQLLRKTDRSKGNVQSGLELLIFDQYTGQERHVKTLSGGESFKAALSLALGLADVVQQYAGGVSLETMFIDEGFGTLDPESLDQAIETLIEIQSGGRLVGIISHVPELKERIDARLEVIATKSGSRTEFQFTN